MKKETAQLAKILRENGVNWFFDYQGAGGTYRFFESALFFKNVDFFKLITNHPDYPSVIPDKNKFLASLLKGAHFKEFHPGIIDILFNHQDRSKNLNWFENPEWPYPLLDNFRNKLSLKEREKHKSLLSHFEQVDLLKKNICQIQTVPQLQEKIQNLPGIEIIFKRENTLLECAIDSSNLELAKYLLANNLINPESLPATVSKVTAAPYSKDNFDFLKSLHQKMKDLNIQHSDRKINNQIWVLANLASDIECLQSSNKSELTEIKSYTDLVQRIMNQALLVEINNLKQAVESSNKDKINSAVKNIQELYVEGGMPINFQDAEGKTLLHHLAPFADGYTIELVEKSLNGLRTRMEQGLQDNQGNTPVHVAILSRNLRGTKVLADNAIHFSQGFAQISRPDLQLKNAAGHTPLDLITNSKFDNKDDRKDRKSIISLIKSQMNR